MLYKYKSFYCPVCDNNLGSHDKTQIVVLHCNECRARFIWKTNDDKPGAILDNESNRKYCGCGCGR
jgi:Zn-finger nucleic acid-binding protein